MRFIDCVCDMVTVVAVFDQRVLKASTWHWMQRILNNGGGGGGGACVCVSACVCECMCVCECVTKFVFKRITHCNWRPSNCNENFKELSHYFGWSKL